MNRMEYLMGGLNNHLDEEGLRSNSKNNNRRQEDMIRACLIGLINDAIDDEHTEKIELTEDEWKELLTEAMNHQVHLMVYESAIRRGNLSQGLIDYWDKLYKLSVINLNYKVSIIPDILKQFNEQGIPVLLLKGLFFRGLYQRAETRTMSDVDFLADRRYFDQIVEILNHFGYDVDKNDPSQMHYKFTHRQYITIELHYSLVRPNRFQQAKMLNQMIWEDIKRIDYCDTYFMVPSDVNMAIYACFHMANHYVYVGGGFGFRQVCDLVLLLNKRFDESKWIAFFEKAKALELYAFIIGVLSVCKKYFNLALPADYNKYINIDHELVDLFFDEIYQSGIFGSRSKTEAANKALSQYSENGRSCLTFLFPPRAHLADAYSYARENALLLPVAWIHRLINNLLRTDIKPADKIPEFKIIYRHERLTKWLKIGAARP